MKFGMNVMALEANWPLYFPSHAINNISMLDVQTHGMRAALVSRVVRTGNLF
jgi:hypothetical protein